MSKTKLTPTDEEVLEMLKIAGRKAVQELWDAGLPAHGMDEGGNIVAFYPDDTQKIVEKDK